MKYISTLNPLALSFVVGAKAFTPSSMSKKTEVPKTVDVDFFNPAKDIDMEHAHDCADHFGKCSIEDLESIRSGKKTYSVVMNTDRKALTVLK